MGRLNSRRTKYETSLDRPGISRSTIGRCIFENTYCRSVAQGVKISVAPDITSGRALYVTFLDLPVATGNEGWFDVEPYLGVKVLDVPPGLSNVTSGQLLITSTRTLPHATLLFLV